MGDFNAKIGEQQQCETMIGPHGFGTRNERGARLVIFAEKEHLSVINTHFKKKPCRKWTWKSPKGTTSEIDYILSNNRTIFIDCSVINRFNFDSDHRLIRTTLRINIQKERNKLMFNTITSINYEKLEARKNEFQLKLSNRFSLLEQLNNIHLSDINKHITDILLTTAKETGGTKKHNRHNKITGETKQLMCKRREWKHNKSTRNNIEYVELCKTIRKRLKEEIRQFNCHLIQTTIENNKSLKKMKQKLMTGTKRLFKIQKKDGSTTSNQQEILKRVKDFYLTLYDDNIEQVAADNSEKTDPPDVLPAEVRKAIQRLKNGKAADQDGITGEILKLCSNETHKGLADLFTKCLKQRNIPTSWKDAKITILHKKRDQ